MPLNTRLLRLEVYRQADRTVTPEVIKLVKLDFATKKEEMLEDFDNHGVTEEIKAGPKAFSRYVSETEGNLFSLLGFDSSQNPIPELRRFLKNNTVLGTTRKGVLRGESIVYETPVYFPTVNEVNEEMADNDRTSLDWVEGRSFTDLIQNGVTGISNYYFSLTRRFKNSRSGTAIQTTKKLREASDSIRPIPYVNEILGTFKKKFTK